MSVLAARFESGSPGAGASTENATKLITSTVGIAIKSRRRAYVVTWASPLLPLRDVLALALPPYEAPTTPVVGRPRPLPVLVFTSIGPSRRLNRKFRSGLNQQGRSAFRRS